MAALYAKLLSLLLALAVGGAAIACPCISPPVREAAAGKFTCQKCEKGERPAKRQSQDCEGCRVTTVVQKSGSMDLSPSALLLISPAPVMIRELAAPSPVFQLEQSQAPPMLLDLVHCSCQLTI